MSDKSRYADLLKGGHEAVLSRITSTSYGGFGLGRTIDPEGFETRAIHSLIDFRRKAVLEIGSGDGRMTWRYAEQAARVLAIDPLAGDVRRAIADTPEHLKPIVRFVEADATNYRYPRSAFDIAVLSHSL